MKTQLRSSASAYIIRVTKTDHGIIVDANLAVSPIFYIFLLGMIAFPFLFVRQIPVLFIMLEVGFLFTYSKLIYQLAKRLLRVPILNITHLLNSISADLSSTDKSPQL